jgi:Mg2+ and Co2+ transporter CorA
MATPKTESNPQAMNKLSWQAQKSIRDIEDWRAWLIDSTDKFVSELKDLAQKKNMPSEDVTNISNVREQLVELKKLLHPLEKSIHKATGRRIQRAKRR